MYEHNALGYWSGLALCLTKSEAVEHAVLRQLLYFHPVVLVVKYKKKIKKKKLLHFSIISNRAANTLVSVCVLEQDTLTLHGTG